MGIHVKAGTNTDYRGHRWAFIGITCLLWFFLLWGLGYMVASKFPDDGTVALATACFFFPVGFFPILFFGAPGMLIGFLQKYLEGAFQLPPQRAEISPPLLWSARRHNNPWLLGLNRLVLFWGPAVLVVTPLLVILFPDGIYPSVLALLLGVLGAVLVGVTATTSTGRPFLHEVQLTPEQRRWQGTFLAYLLWRHGIPWGLGNGLLNAILAIPLFPVTPGADPDLASSFMVSVDTFFTAVILCFFMAVSAHPHAMVDGRLGVIRPPENARSPAQGARICLLALASLGVALGTWLVLKAAGIDHLSLRAFIVWKALAATVIAGGAAMLIAYWTLARERVPGTLQPEALSG